MPEERINIFAYSKVFCLTTLNSGMYVMPEGRNSDAAVHRHTDSLHLGVLTLIMHIVKLDKRKNLVSCKSFC
jgi:hypothetical protein